jgi:hypothetical protein
VYHGRLEVRRRYIESLRRVSRAHLNTSLNAATFFVERQLLLVKPTRESPVRYSEYANYEKSGATYGGILVLTVQPSTSTEILILSPSELGSKISITQCSVFRVRHYLTDEGSDGMFPQPSSTTIKQAVRMK